MEIFSPRQVLLLCVLTFVPHLILSASVGFQDLNTTTPAPSVHNTNTTAPSVHNTNTTAPSVHNTNTTAPSVLSTTTEASSVQICSKCAPGFGVIAPCNGTADTQCAECPPGTFNNVYTLNNPCRPCGTCPDGHYQRTPCIPSQDVNCAKCYKNGGGFGNEDFLRKCETTTTSTTTPTPPTTTSAATTTRGLPVVLPVLPPKDPSTRKPPPGVSTTTTPAPKVKVVTPTVQRKTTTQNLKVVPSLNEIINQVEETTEGVVVVAAGNDPKIGAATAIDTGGFEWSILVAAVAAAVVFFILGILVSKCVHKPNTKARPEFALDYGDVPNDDTVDSSPTVTMISQRPLEGAVAYQDYDNPATPIYNGNGAYLPVIEEVSFINAETPLEAVPLDAGNDVKARPDVPPVEPPSVSGTLEPLVPPGAPRLHRKPPPTVNAFRKFMVLMRKPFYRSRDLRYIDEDSDDEIVRHLGRPPSVNYTSPRQRRSDKRRQKQRRRKSSILSGSGSLKRRWRRSGSGMTRGRYVSDPSVTGYGSDNYSTDPGTPTSVRSDVSLDTMSAMSVQLEHVPEVWVKNT